MPMLDSRFKLEIDDPALKIAILDGADFNAGSLVSCLRSISIDKPPLDTDKIICFNELHGMEKWGRVIFTKDNCFIKAEYTSRLADRLAPFDWLGFKKSQKNLLEVEELRQAGKINAPGLLGAFCIKREEGWLWSGFITELLEGYRELSEKNPYDIEIQSKAIDSLAEIGFVNLDMCLWNIMTNDSTGDWKIVDWEFLEHFNGTKEELRKKMLEVPGVLL